MSETDDTDDLLLIPPDFFHQSELEIKDDGSLFDIVDNLITEVTDLKDRVNIIENTSDISGISNSFDLSIDINSMENKYFLRKFHSSEDLTSSTRYKMSESTQSTPNKPLSKFKLSSLPPTPKFDRFSPKKKDKPKTSPSQPKKTPNKYENKNNTPRNGSGERENFISNVQTIRRVDLARNLEDDFQKCKSHDKNFDVTDVDQMVRDLEVKQHEIENRLRNKERELFHNEPIVIKERKRQLGDDIETVPDYNFGMRHLLYENNNIKNIKTKREGNVRNQNNHLERQGTERATQQNVSPVGNSDKLMYSNNNERSTSESSTDSTQTTALNRFPSPESIQENAINVINHHRKLLKTDLEGKVRGKDENKHHHNNDFNLINHNLGLVSLTNLWNDRANFSDLNAVNCKQKLQEERLRRQHCEELIQTLQNRILELQERIAVAIQVDEAKDNALIKFLAAWENAVIKLNKVLDEKAKLEEDRNKLKEHHSIELKEIHQKAVHYEAEASKALHLAHGNQEKLAFLENQSTHLQKSLELLETKFSELQKLYDDEVEKSKQLADLIAKKEIDLSRLKHSLTDAKREITESNKAVGICQTDLTHMKSEYTKLEATLKDRDNKIVDLERQKRKLVEEVDIHKNITKTLQEEVNKVRNQMDSSKIELKNFYQGQVEIVVQNKLQEFQSQLDQAERALREELKKKEMSIAKTAAGHVQQISEKYTLEINLLEEKHKEEVRLYKLQLSQYQQQIESLESKFLQQQVKRENIAHQLKKMMEAQWSEALKIISNTNRSPLLQPDNTFNTIDQLNSLKSKSYNNIEEVLSNIGDDNQKTEVERRNPKRNLNAESFCSLTEDPDRNTQSTFKVPEETPVSSRLAQNRLSSESEIQKYMQMLLSKQPGSQFLTMSLQSQINDDSPKDRTSWHSGSRRPK